MKILVKNRITAASVIRRLLLGWLIAACLEYIMLPRAAKTLVGTAALGMMSISRMFLVTALITGMLLLLSRYFDTLKIERWGVAAAFALLATLTLIDSFRWAYLGGCVFVMGVLLVYVIKGWNSGKERRLKRKGSARDGLWLTAALTCVFFLLVGAWGAGRVWSFTSPTYDFGIFSQMFYSMRTSGTPITTLERETRMSHFYVHVSPIYYLMLPFYCVVPYPVTLQILQAAVLASSVIPLWKLGTHFGLPGWQKMFLCLVLMLYPAFAGGTGYDLHENCFLTPLILWLFYGIEKKNIPITAVSAVLTLTVKEDAAVYVAVIGLYLLVKTVLRGKKADKQNLITGISLLGVSLVWFFAVTGYLASSGDGVMTYRYNNFIYDGSGSLMTVIKAVLMNPMKALYECVDAEKLSFINLTLLPVLCLPFFTRRYERYILLIPYVLVNLMSDYQYQHDIFFQYTFGSNAFLIYLTAVNIADLKLDWKKVATLGATAAVALAFFTANVIPKGQQYQELASTYKPYYDSVRTALDIIPEDASVATTTFYTTYLSQRDVLYDIRYCSREHLLETEFVALKPSATADYKKYATSGQNNGYENVVGLLEGKGYKLVEKTSAVVIYQKPNTE